MHLRTVSLVLAAELARTHRGNDLVSRTISRVIQRADEITELLAYYQLSNERKGPKKLNRLSKQVQRGIALAFNKFDEYQFTKYNRQTEVKLRDALFLAHPKPKDEEQQGLFNKIVSNTLDVPYTWEVELSVLGQQKFETKESRTVAFKAKWEELIESCREAGRKLGYMALLRNLRNILDAEVSAAHMVKVCQYLTNVKAVENSKQLPFRFLAAYRELLGNASGFTAMVLDALEEAVKISVQNIKAFDEQVKVVLACDVSSSMQRAVSAKSKIMNYDIGLMLDMLMQHRCKNVVSGMFGDRWKIINLPSQSVLANVQEFYRREGEVEYATNGYLVIRDLIIRKVKADKVMLFTDCQLWDSGGGGNHMAQEWKKYKTIFPSAKLYLFDLVGYGQVPIDLKQDDVFLIAGWSDKVFDVLEAIENGKGAIAEIGSMEV